MQTAAMVVRFTRAELAAFQGATVDDLLPPPGQPLRLQGHGTVPRETYGLPARGWLGFGTNAHDVTLGLDLVWRRHRAR